MDRPPEDESQITIILAEMPKPGIANPVNVPRSTSAGLDCLANDQLVSLKSSQSLPHCSRRNSNSLTDFLHAAAAHAVKLLQEFLIVAVDSNSHDLSLIHI